MLSHMVPLMPCTRPPPWWWMWSPGAGRHGGSLAAAGWTLTRQLFSHLGRGTAGYSVGWGPQVKPSQGLRVHLLSPPWEPAEQEAALMRVQQTRWSWRARGRQAALGSWSAGSSMGRVEALCLGLWIDGENPAPGAALGGGPTIT